MIKYFKTMMILVLINFSCEATKILHISFHQGCIQEIKRVAENLNWDLTSLYIHDLPPGEFDGKTKGNAIYNIGSERANNIWNKHKDYFNQFDLIITSDTGPLCRIFLQNNFQGKLIVWVCNRFDYCDGASLDCDFPDTQYYELIKKSLLSEKVRFVSYTEFERIYAISKGIDWGDFCIKPCGFNWGLSIHEQNSNSKDKLFLIPDYISNHNLKLEQRCQSLGIPAFLYRYSGPNDLKKITGIIHIPYSWSNLALFENLSNGITYFIPSKHFMLQLLDNGGAWWPNQNFVKEYLQFSEWYNADMQNILIYFDSWADLKTKVLKTKFLEFKQRALCFASQHRTKMLQKWQLLVSELTI